MFSNDLYSLQNPPRPLGHPAATAQLPHTSASSNLVPLVSIPTAPPRKMTNQRVGSEPDGEGLSWRCPRITNLRQRGGSGSPGLALVPPWGTGPWEPVKKSWGWWVKFSSLIYQRNRPSRRLRAREGGNFTAQEK